MKTWISLLCVLIFGCQAKKTDEQKLFSKKPSHLTGVSFSNVLSDRSSNIIDYMYYYNGGGVATGDLNNDGLSDVFFTSSEGTNRLYVNRGDFIFEDITESAGVNSQGYRSTGVVFVDLNADGFLDIYVCQVGHFQTFTGENRLYINNGDLTFTNKAKEYGLNFSGLSTHAAFFDFDNDGDLDVYLLNHSVHAIGKYGSSSQRMTTNPIAGDRLYRNISTDGKFLFEDVTSEFGIYSSPIGYGLGLTVSDINNDGWMDIYVGNDFHESDYLYINQNGQGFVESLAKWTSHTSRYSMGCDAADLNGDLLLDVVSLDMLPSTPEILLRSVSEDTQEVFDIKTSFGYRKQYVRNNIQMNMENCFVESAQYLGVHNTDWSWSPLISDYDNNGEMDLFITTGIEGRPNDLDYVNYASSEANTQVDYRDLIGRMPKLSIPNRMFTFKSDAPALDVSNHWGLAEPSVSTGASYCDLDNDGDLDIVINNCNQEASIYKNFTREMIGNNFISIELLDSTTYNIHGVGSKVYIFHQGKVQVREVSLSRGFQSAVSHTLNFGLGTGASVDSVVVFWNGNKTVSQVLSNVSINSKHIIHRGVTKMSGHLPKRNSKFAIVRSDVPNYHHKEDTFFSDFKIEPLIPYQLSREGPPVVLGDVNGDGLSDFFIGGGSGQSARLYIQNRNGFFSSVYVEAFEKDAQFEDVDAAFDDFNNDGLLDLYVASGGNVRDSLLLVDRVYLGDRNKWFERSVASLPPYYVNTSSVKVLDFNRDGISDLFVGGRSVPGSYGRSPKSFFLVGSRDGRFKIDQTYELGMITDAEPFDFNGDGWIDLCVAGDWMPIQILINDNGFFRSLDNVEGIKDLFGWWRSLALADINSDGLMDIIAGNVGLNLKIKPSDFKPVFLYLDDFDANGQMDPILFYNHSEKYIPFQTKSQLGKHLPFLNKKFNSYKAFSLISSPDELIGNPSKDLVIHKANTFETVVLVNRGKSRGFEKIQLPAIVQLTTINDIQVVDTDQDGISDIVLVGNSNTHSIDLGDSGNLAIIVLQGTSDGKFIWRKIDNCISCQKTARHIRYFKERNEFIVSYNGSKAEVISLVLK